MEQAKAILKRYWGYDTFRPMQEEVIQTILQQKDCIVLMPTGGGKSLCYQIPALLSDGLTIVVSPLVSLMQDQVQQLKEKNIAAEYIHSGMQYGEVTQLLEQALYGQIKLLYVSPERLQNKQFNDFLPRFYLSLIAVDEAHCISQWGHDFRPEYLQIADLRNLFPEVPMVALTATATSEVLHDLAASLRLQNTFLFRQSFDRKNIFYALQYSENKQQEIVQYFTANKSCGIVYCRSRRKTEELALLLQQNGIEAGAYHAGMPKDKRKQAQENWMNNTMPVIVATSAFGMGIDKPDVRSVIHADAPEHLEAYYQEVGRAGRDGAAARAIVLFNQNDIKRLEESTALYFPPDGYLRLVYQSVCEYLQIPIGNQPDDYFDFDLPDFLQKFKLEAVPATHALRLLAQEELWSLSESLFRPATLQFVVGRQTLDDLNAQYPDIALVTTGLLRLFSGIFHYPAVIRINTLARHLQLSVTDTERVLQKLHQMNVLEYKPAKEGPQLHFHHYRVDSQHLLIDHQRIARLRESHALRTKHMVAFLRNEIVCRNKILLNYFDEATRNNCMHCDVCSQQNAEREQPETIQKAIIRILKEKGNLSFNELLHHLNGSGQAQVAIIRTMLDDGILCQTPDARIALV